MGARVAVRGVIVLALAIVVGVAAALMLAPAPEISPVPQALKPPAAAPASIAWPESRSAGVAVAGIDGSLATSGSDDAHPMASVTKIVTVLVVLDRHPIEGASRGATITVGRSDVQAVNAALADNAPVAPVSVGTVVSQRDLIEWALVDSSANAAWSLANWAFGSTEAFLAAADDFADRNGLRDTDLADPAGLDARSVSSARDLTNIMLLAVDTPAVLATLQLKSVRIPGVVIAQNTNRILGQGNIDGGKTGTLRVWGRNLAVTAERTIDGQRRRVVAVVMGTIPADEIDRQMLALVDSLWDDFGEVTVVSAGTVVARYEPPWGVTVTAATTEAIAVKTFGDVVPGVTATTRSLAVSQMPRDVGEAVVEFGGERLTAAVRTVGGLAEPDVAWRLTHPLEVLGWYRQPSGD